MMDLGGQRDWTPVSQVEPSPNPVAAIARNPRLSSSFGDFGYTAAPVSRFATGQPPSQAQAYYGYHMAAAGPTQRVAADAASPSDSNTAADREKDGAGGSHTRTYQGELCLVNGTRRQRVNE